MTRLQYGLRLLISIVISFAVLVVPIDKAFAFGAEGHEAVCEIAFRELTQAAKEKVRLWWRL